MQKCLIAPSIWELKVSFVFDILYRFILYYWKSWSRNPMVTPVFMCDLPVKVIMNFNFKVRQIMRSYSCVHSRDSPYVPTNLLI